MAIYIGPFQSPEKHLESVRLSSGGPLRNDSTTHRTWKLRQTAIQLDLPGLGQWQLTAWPWPWPLLLRAPHGVQLSG